MFKDMTKTLKAQKLLSGITLKITKHIFHMPIWIIEDGDLYCEKMANSDVKRTLIQKKRTLIGPYFSMDYIYAKPFIKILGSEQNIPFTFVDEVFSLRYLYTIM